jgi:hypothetical protein
MIESWRPVVGYEGLYEVSDQGTVRSLDRVVIRSDGRRRTCPGVQLKQAVRPDGHAQLNLSRCGRYRTRRTHQLVIEAFVGPCPDGMEVCHNDGDPLNNHLGNLRYDTQSENARDVVRHGRHKNAIKTHCPQDHPYSEANTYIWRRRRYCRVCSAEHLQNHKARKAAA